MMGAAPLPYVPNGERMPWRAVTANGKCFSPGIALIEQKKVIRLIPVTAAWAAAIVAKAAWTPDVAGEVPFPPDEDEFT